MPAPAAGNGVQPVLPAPAGRGQQQPAVAVVQGSESAVPTTQHATGMSVGLSQNAAHDVLAGICSPSFYYIQNRPNHPCDLQPRIHHMPRTALSTRQLLPWLATRWGSARSPQRFSVESTRGIKTSPVAIAVLEPLVSTHVLTHLHSSISCRECHVKYLHTAYLLFRICRLRSERGWPPTSCMSGRLTRP